MLQGLLGALAAVLWVAGGYMGLGLGEPVYALLLLAGGFVPAAGAFKLSAGQGQGLPKLDAASMPEEQRQLLMESFDKAVADYNALEKLREEIKDKELESQLAEMQAIAYRLLTYLEEHPEKTAKANRFATYYQDRAVQLAQQYRDLEKTGLATQQVQETKQRVKATLASFDEAYAAEFEKLLSDQLLDMDAELKVLGQNIEAEGLKDEVIVQRAEELKQPVEGAGSLQPRQGSEVAVRQEQSPVNHGGRKHGRRRGHDAAREVMLRYAHTPAEIRTEVIKQKGINAALAILLGTFGAHKFYQGKTFTGVLYALFCWSTIPTFVSFIEGLRYAVMPVDDYYKQYFRD